MVFFSLLPYTTIFDAICGVTEKRILAAVSHGKTQFESRDVTERRILCPLPHGKAHSAVAMRRKSALCATALLRHHIYAPPRLSLRVAHLQLACPRGPSKPLKDVISRGSSLGGNHGLDGTLHKRAVSKVDPVILQILDNHASGHDRRTHVHNEDHAIIAQDLPYRCLYALVTRPEPSVFQAPRSNHPCVGCHLTPQGCRRLCKLP